MAPLKGVHRVRKANAGGLSVYWYAWRGGPRILSCSAKTELRLQQLVDAAAEEAGRRYFELHEARKTPAKGLLHGLAVDWMASPEFALLADRTRKDLRRLLSVVQADLGTLPVRALDARGARKVLLDWRNRYQHIPCVADRQASALSQLLGWARNQGITAADPMRQWPWIYRVDRSGIVWSAAEIEAICAKAEPELQLAILFAAYSGLRQGDLIGLTWSAIGEDAIVRRTRKRGRVVTIPITPALRLVLEACPEGDSTQVLTKDGQPWKASTLNKRWALARAAAVKTCPSIQGKRWHDLRGSYATLLIRAGTPADDVDRIMGWKKGNSEQTRASYVAGDVVAEAAIRRLKFTAAA